MAPSYSNSFPTRPLIRTSTGGDKVMKDLDSLLSIQEVFIKDLPTTTFELLHNSRNKMKITTQVTLTARNLDSMPGMRKPMGFKDYAISQGEDDDGPKQAVQGVPLQAEQAD
ncbi:hypothetical protein Tco_0848554 [Tanacetum coccineum]